MSARLPELEAQLTALESNDLATTRLLSRSPLVGGRGRGVRGRLGAGAAAGGIDSDPEDAALQGELEAAEAALREATSRSTPVDDGIGAGDSELQVLSEELVAAKLHAEALERTLAGEKGARVRMRARCGDHVWCTVRRQASPLLDALVSCHGTRTRVWCVSQHRRNEPTRTLRLAPSPSTGCKTPLPRWVMSSRCVATPAIVANHTALPLAGLACTVSPLPPRCHAAVSCVPGGGGAPPSTGGASARAGGGDGDG